jgi:hypothetical protein
MRIYEHEKGWSMLDLLIKCNKWKQFRDSRVPEITLEFNPFLVRELIIRLHNTISLEVELFNYVWKNMFIFWVTLAEF